MSKGYPPRKVREVCAILCALGFKFDRTEVSHEQREKTAKDLVWTVTVDTAVSDSDDFLWKSMMAHAGMGHLTFYGATESRARKFDEPRQI